jgi:SAM-dependent methyltransferase
MAMAMAMAMGRSVARTKPAPPRELAVVACQTCHFTFIPEGRLALSHSSQSAAPVRDPEHEGYRRGLRSELLRRLAAQRLGRTPRMIDVGCGDGSFAGLFVGRAQVEGLESQPEDALRASRRGIRVYRTRLDGPFAERHEGQYDLVVCTQVLEHQPKPHVFLTHLRRLLRPGGLALLEVPSFDRIKASTAAHSIIPEHVGYFTAGTLCWALERHFSVLSLETGFREQFLRAVVRNDRVSELEFGRARGAWLKTIEDEIRRCGKQGVVMWGAGTRGVSLIAMSRVLREGTRAVVDSDPRKLGATVPGTPFKVQSPTDILRLAPAAILISAVTYRPEIEKRLRKLGYKGRIILTEAACPRRAKRGFPSPKPRSASPRPR